MRNDDLVNRTLGQRETGFHSCPISTCLHALKWPSQNLSSWVRILLNWKLTSEPAALSEGSPNIREQLNLPFLFDLKIPEIPYALSKYVPIRTSQSSFSICAQSQIRYLSMLSTSSPRGVSANRLLGKFLICKLQGRREEPPALSPQRVTTLALKPWDIFLAGKWKNNPAARFGRALAPWGLCPAVKALTWDGISSQQRINSFSREDLNISFHSSTA